MEAGNDPPKYDDGDDVDEDDDAINDGRIDIRFVFVCAGMPTVVDTIPAAAATMDGRNCGRTRMSGSISITLLFFPLLFELTALPDAAEPDGEPDGPLPPLPSFVADTTSRRTGELYANAHTT
jgi:hypothetical protein